jgi:hypothetical protein
MNRTITTIIPILATVGILTMLIWLNAAREVWLGIATLGMLVGGIYEYRQNRPPELRRRNLFVIGGAFAFLIIAYVLSTVRPS